MFKKGFIYQQIYKVDELNDEKVGYIESLSIGAAPQTVECVSCTILINNNFLPV